MIKPLNIFSVVLLVCGTWVGPGFAERKPNVIVILADDLGFADVGFHGCKDIPTPHLDRLAASGVRCTNGYVSHSFCSPTRAGLMTGRYQQRFGHENNPAHEPDNLSLGLPVDETLLPKAIKPAGYVSGIIGKWHLGAAPPFHPLARGFDEQYGFTGGGHQYFAKQLIDRDSHYRSHIERNGKREPTTGYLTTLFSEEAAAFITRHKDDPFFLYLAYNAPHTPLQAPPEYIERCKHIDDDKRRVYGAMVCALDDGVGLVLDTLNKLDLDDDTLIFFLSDNGGPDTVTHASNAPLRGRKGQVYEGGIHVPFVVRWTGKLPAGAVYEQPVSSLDIFVTTLALTGAPAPPKPLDGVNLMPYLLGQAKGAPHERLFWRQGGGQAYAVREGVDKYLHIRGHDPEFYQLDSDLAEHHNVITSQADAADALQRKLDAWNSQLIDPLWQNPRAGKPKNANKAK
ncbi:sulfatase-like hydrolase/transferase [Planctomycetales bacterium ZRK34]|nr:sulfatase-like hydrolase/transferase [Planctomycetales bacterium ZRK34]